MDYQKIYDDFIKDRRTKEYALIDSDKYREAHHIIPRSLGGSDDGENIISLSHGDHYFAHCCLAKIHGGGMWLALEMMSDWVSKTHGRSFAFTQSKLTSIARERYWEENRRWTKDALILEAEKYSSVGDFKSGSGSAYTVALSKPYRDEIFNGLSRKVKSTARTLESCIKEAAKHRTKKEWEMASPYSYQKSLAKGWMDQCSMHMGTCSRQDKKKAVINVTTGQVFDSLRSAASAFGIKENGIGNVLSGRAKTSGGFRWEYI